MTTHELASTPRPQPLQLAHALDEIHARQLAHAALLAPLNISAQTRSGESPSA